MGESGRAMSGLTEVTAMLRRVAWLALLSSSSLNYAIRVPLHISANR